MFFHIYVPKRYPRGQKSKQKCAKKWLKWHQKLEIEHKKYVFRYIKYVFRFMVWENSLKQEINWIRMSKVTKSQLFGEF